MDDTTQDTNATPPVSEKSLTEQFLDIAEPDPYGFTKEIRLDDLIAVNPAFKLGNGGSWCRDDGPLGRQYKIKRIKEGSRIVAVKLEGPNRSPTNKGIKADIVKTVSDMRCAVLWTGKPQVDHKEGTYDDHKLLAKEKQTIDMFQPLSQAANSAKRQHCKVCLASKQRVRFDARNLGYKEGWFLGDQYSNTCVGCYWHDPKKFNQEVSRGFVPTDRDDSSGMVPDSRSDSTD